jgi:hypothetical protein
MPRGESACADQQCTGTLLDDGRKSRRDLAFGRGNESKQAHPENMGRSLQIGPPKTSGGTLQVCNRVGRRHQFVQQLKALSGQLGTNVGDAGEIARGTIEARYHANLDGVAGYRENEPG